jgi:hypothetical protein
MGWSAPTDVPALAQRRQLIASRPPLPDGRSALPELRDDIQSFAIVSAFELPVR